MSLNAELSSYVAVLDKLHQTLLPRTYLEIGVFHGDTLALALDCTRSVGIDPRPDVSAPLPPAARIVRQTSDDFFASARADELLTGGIDLAFVDGMHLFEFALRDLANIELHSRPGTVVVMHDCLPRTRTEAQRERHGSWTGDVWKVLYCLREERPDVDITLIRVPPTGLAIVQGLDATSPVLGAVDTEKYAHLEFEDLQNDLLPSMKIVDASWQQIEAILPAEPFQEPREPVQALVELRAQRRPSLASRTRLTRRAARSRVKRTALWSVIGPWWRQLRGRST